MHEQCYSNDQQAKEQMQSEENASSTKLGAKGAEHDLSARGTDDSQSHLSGGQSARPSVQYKQKGSTSSTEYHKLSAGTEDIMPCQEHK